MASKQVIDAIRRKRQRMNALRQAARFNKNFRWALKRGDVITFNVPDHGDSEFMKKIAEGPLAPPPELNVIGGTITDAKGEVKDIRSLDYMSLLTSLSNH